MAQQLICKHILSNCPVNKITDILYLTELHPADISKDTQIGTAVAIALGATRNQADMQGISMTVSMSDMLKDTIRILGIKL